MKTRICMLDDNKDEIDIVKASELICIGKRFQHTTLEYCSL